MTPIFHSAFIAFHFCLQVQQGIWRAMYRAANFTLLHVARYPLTSSMFFAWDDLVPSHLSILPCPLPSQLSHVFTLQ
jgi:hypothetical protein